MSDRKLTIACDVGFKKGDIIMFDDKMMIVRGVEHKTSLTVGYLGLVNLMMWYAKNKLVKFITIVLLVLAAASVAHSRSLEYIATSVTFHPFVSDEAADNLSHKLGFGGRLNHTHMAGLAYTDEDLLTYQSYKGFMGTNSVGEAMGGAVYSTGFKVRWLQLGVVLGGYLQDKGKFDEKGLDLGVGGDFMPVFGVEFNQKVYFSDTEFIKLTNTITPVITNHAVSIGADF